ncbi:MAG: protein kinase, partial [Planctomycetota bacterium]
MTAPSARKLFLNYRQEDTGVVAARLVSDLVQRFEPGQIFVDCDGVDLSENWADRLRTEVASCDVFLCLIGERWLTLQGVGGRRRLDEKDDWVRFEIEVALDRCAEDLAVLPIVVEPGKLPERREFPESIDALPSLQGASVDAANNQDWDRLVDRISKLLDDRGFRRRHSQGPGADSPGALRAGVQLGNRFTLVEQIGSGGFSRVWRAEADDGSQSVAIKVLHPARADDPQALEAFYAGAALQQRWAGSHVAEVVQPPQQDGDLHWFAMEHCAGGTLSSWTRKLCDKRLQVLGVLGQLGKELDRIAGAEGAHGDVKPSNVVLAEGDRPKLVDFDQAGEAGVRDFVTRPVADMSFAAPEVIEGQKPSRRSDVYSFAKTVLDSLTSGGLLPGVLMQLDDPEVQKRVFETARIPCAGRPLLSRALGREEEGRPASCAEIVESLAGPSVPGPSDTRRPSPAIVGASLLVVLASLLLFADPWDWLGGDGPPGPDLPSMQQPAWLVGLREDIREIREERWDSKAAFAVLEALDRGRETLSSESMPLAVEVEVELFSHPDLGERPDAAVVSAMTVPTREGESWWCPIGVGNRRDQLSYRMGSPEGEEGRFEDEGPAHDVVI